MVKINLVTYHITLLNKQNSTKVKLDNIIYGTLNPEDQPKTIMELLFKFLSDNKNDNHYESNNKVLFIKDFNVDNEKIFFGEFLYGTSGTENKVKDIKDTNTEFTLSKNQSVLTPYYFYIEIPKGNTHGLLILESKGNDGIKTLFEEWFGKFIEEHSHTNLKLELKSFLPEKVINTYLNKGVLKKIRFLSNKLPVDELDILNDYEPDEGYAEFKLQINKDNRKKLTTKIKNLIYNTSQESQEYKYILGDSIETEEIKFEIDLKGSYRTFTINQLKNAVPARDITDELEKGSDGHRTFKSIHDKGKEYATDIYSSI